LRAAKIVAKAIPEADSVEQKGVRMAENDAQSAGPPARNYGEHEKTYPLFLQRIRHSAACIAVVFVFLAVLFS
jgi:hypothetical protein